MGNIMVEKGEGEYCATERYKEGGEMEWEVNSLVH